VTVIARVSDGYIPIRLELAERGPKFMAIHIDHCTFPSRLRWLLRAVESVRVAAMPGLVGAAIWLDGDHLYVRVGLSVLHCDTGAPIEVAGGEMLMVEQIEARARVPFKCEPLERTVQQDVAALIRRALVKAYEHEVDECIRWDDGTKVRDPHVERR
jgi:hypothetical protein